LSYLEETLKLTRSFGINSHLHRGIFTSSEGHVVAELINAGSPIKEMPGDIIFLSDSTIEIMKEIFHQISKDVYHMNEEILNTLGGHFA
jgi:hypothetical protein